MMNPMRTLLAMALLCLGIPALAAAMDAPDPDRRYRVIGCW